jgi:hypothetical protein
LFSWSIPDADLGDGQRMQIRLSIKLKKPKMLEFLKRLHASHCHQAESGVRAMGRVLDLFFFLLDRGNLFSMIFFVQKKNCRSNACRFSFTRSGQLHGNPGSER